LSIAAENQNFPLLAGALVLMVLTVILVNRLLWAKLYELAHNRFNIESAI
jgi:NitT/TauT family transport system permease protein